MMRFVQLFQASSIGCGLRTALSVMDSSEVKKFQMGIHMSAQCRSQRSKVFWGSGPKSSHVRVCFDSKITVNQST